MILVSRESFLIELRDFSSFILYLFIFYCFCYFMCVMLMCVMLI